GVAVGVAELGEGHVVRAAGVRAWYPGAVDDVLHLADLDAAGGQFVAGGEDVGDDEQSLLGAGSGGVAAVAESDRARRSGRGDLHDPLAGEAVGDVYEQVEAGLLQVELL